jgi:ATPases involved in chromosome partitioning
MSKLFEVFKELENGKRGCPLGGRENSNALALKNLESKLGPQTSAALGNLVNRLLLGDAGPRCVLFAGAAPGVGCSWIVAHSAEALCAQTNASVCIVEVGATSGWVGNYFMLQNDKGPERLLESTMRTSVRQVASNLWVIPGGDIQGADFIFPYEDLEACLIELRDKFEYVLLDMTALPSSSQVRPTNLVDGAVLVLKAGETPRRAVKRAIDDLGNCGIKVLGTVLNQREYPIPASLYRHL